MSHRSARVLFVATCSFASAGCPRRAAPATALVGDAHARDATARAPDVRPAPPPYSREARGTLANSPDDETRCETGDNAVVLFGGPALFTVSAADRVEGMRVWARSHGHVTVVIETEGSDDALPSCAEAETDEGVAELAFPTEAWTVLRVYLASRTGATGPFVAGITNAEQLPATEPAPLPPPADDEVRARWSFTTTPCREDECHALALELTGAVQRTLTTPSDLGESRSASFAPRGASTASTCARAAGGATKSPRATRRTGSATGGVRARRA